MSISLDHAAAMHTKPVPPVPEQLDLFTESSPTVTADDLARALASLLPHVRPADIIVNLDERPQAKGPTHASFGAPLRKFAELLHGELCGQPSPVRCLVPKERTR